MFLNLFFKECKKILTSIIYIIFIGVMILFHVTQFSDAAGVDISEVNSSSKYNPTNPLMIPPEDAENYGSKPAEIPEQVMPNATRALVIENIENSYITYPIGFYKNVRLNEKEQEIIKNIIKEITGLEVQDALDRINKRALEAQEEYEYPFAREITYEDVVPIKVSYDDFKEKMEEIDKLLGGGSGYALKNLKKYGSLPITYEEKLQEYNDLINEDKITGAYARLFCDYMGIVAALFSIFVPVAFLIKDRRAKANEVLYSRQMGTFKLLFSRYLALIFMMLTPLLLLSMVPLSQLMAFGSKNNLTVDAFAFIKYIMTWIFPSLLTTTSVAFFFTILTDTPIAILVQFVWSFISISSGGLMGNYGMNMVIRHNSTADFQIYKEGINQILFNRISYSCFAVVVLVITMLIYEQKRRGRLDLGGSYQKIFKNFIRAN